MRADPPVQRDLRLQLQPRRRRARLGARSRAGFAREDLFSVVHEHFQTDTADFADILLPATTQLEHTDIHKSYGHLYALANNPAIAPLGEALPNTEVFRRLAARMGFDRSVLLATRDEELARAGVPLGRRAHAGHRLGRAEARGLAAAERAATLRAVRGRRLSRRRRASASSGPRRSRRRARTRCPPIMPPRESRGVQSGARASAIRSRSSRRPRATSSTRRSPTCPPSSAEEASRSSTSIPTTPPRAASPTAIRVRIFNDRGSFAGHRAGDRPRAAGRRRRAVDLVEEARAGRQQRQRGDRARR